MVDDCVDTCIAGREGKWVCLWEREQERVRERESKRELPASRSISPLLCRSQLSEFVLFSLSRWIFFAWIWIYWFLLFLISLFFVLCLYCLNYAYWLLLFLPHRHGSVIFSILLACTVRKIWREIFEICLIQMIYWFSFGETRILIRRAFVVLMDLK